DGFNPINTITCVNTARTDNDPCKFVMTAKSDRDTMRAMTERVVALGARLRALRRQQHLSQTELARRLRISPSYLNLIEHDRRVLSADLLIKLGEILPIDLKSFSPEHSGRTITELFEVFGDPMFDNLNLITQDIREMAAAYPTASQGVIRLYEAFNRTREQ